MLFAINILWSNGIALYNLKDSSIVLTDFRLPKAISALFCGGMLAISGLIMQNIFKNPLAGPDVLGISRGAALAVALSVMAGIQVGGLSLMAILGALAYLLMLLWASKHVKSSVSLLLVGVMGGFLLSAVISTLEVYSNAESLKSFVLWSMGSFAKVNLEQSIFWPIVSIIVLIGSLKIAPQLDVLLLGDQQAKLMGIDAQKILIYGILISALAIGFSISLCGPIAFVGLVAPHLAKWYFKTYKHKWLIFGSALLGGIITLVADILSSGLLGAILPLNATLSVLAAPVILILIIRKNFS